MVTVTLASLKSGTGKTTTATHLLTLAGRGRGAAGVDTDRQGSLITWAARAGEAFPPVTTAYGSELKPAHQPARPTGRPRHHRHPQ